MPIDEPEETAELYTVGPAILPGRFLTRLEFESKSSIDNALHCGICSQRMHSMINVERFHTDYEKNSILHETKT